jgi:hypothetical protein
MTRLAKLLVSCTRDRGSARAAPPPEPGYSCAGAS